MSAATSAPVIAGLLGSLSWFHLADVLQVVSLSKRPSKIIIDDGRDVVTSIYLHGDLVVDVVSGDLSREQAFCRAFGVGATGRFEVQHVGVVPNKDPLGSITALIMASSDRLGAGDSVWCGPSQGSGRTPIGDVFLEGKLGDFPLEDVLPALVHPDRASRMVFRVRDTIVGGITLAGNYVGPCDHYGRYGASAFDALLYETPSIARFSVERIPIDSVQEGHLLGHANRMLLSAVVRRDESLHGLTPPGGVINPVQTVIEVTHPSWEAEETSPGLPESLDSDFKTATHYLIAQRYDEAEALLTFVLSIDPHMERAKRALDRVWEWRLKRSNALLSPRVKPPSPATVAAAMRAPAVPAVLRMEPLYVDVGVSKRFKVVEI